MVLRSQLNSETNKWLAPYKINAKKYIVTRYFTFVAPNNNAIKNVDTVSTRQTITGDINTNTKYLDEWI